MLAALIVLLVVVALLSCVVAALAARDRRPSPWAEKLRQAAVVTTTNGTTFRGVLWVVEPELLVLRDAELLTTDGVAPADGEVLIERTRVDYIQVLP